MGMFAYILFSLISAVLYRLGGYGKPFNTKYRDFGCPLMFVLSMIALGVSVPIWVHIISFGLMFASMTTYHDYLTKDGRENWVCWAMTGFTYGFSAILYASFMGAWVGFAVRTFSLVLLTAFYSEAVGNATAEESGRGFLFNITAPLLLI